MCNINEILQSLKNLNHSELQLLFDQTKERLDDYRPVYISESFKRCGKAGCTCGFGPVKEYGHGPYLYAIWTDREGKKKQRSLGRKMEDVELDKMCSKSRPKWYEFKLTEKQIAKMSQDRKWQNLPRKLSSDEFEDYHGIPMSEDTMGRERELTYDYKRYDLAVEKWNETMEICNSSFARVLGIGTRKGYTLLKGLLENGYYLAS